MGRPLERFCKRGHDTEALGRDSNYYCKGCRRESDRRRDPKRRALEAARTSRRGKHTPRYPIEWERARVERWLEIVRDDPRTNNKSTQLRGREFESRYEKLEAVVPTPVDI
jgi:hypothetical protein